ncbi:zinc finger CCCH domain-containing protein 19 [Malania oleifera]|uniref:zinc finger CCCH domain-containing protein 19 n=1 Tax=Malania oleifera TaxID=397392 RepID=UPI0025AE7222|nr:zinc finger CCCH domain-containing protein 19 [Malania oleifera]
MDEDEELSVAHKPTPQIEEEPDNVVEEEPASTEQCEPLPQLDDSQLAVGASTVAEREPEEAIATEEEPPAAGEVETETEAAEGEREAVEPEAEAVEPEAEAVELEAEVAETEEDAAETEGKSIAEEDPPVADTEVETETEMAELEIEAAETEVDVTEGEVDVAETEVDVADTSKSGGGKRKRGRNSRAPARVPSRKKVEEDVCFICFDGGDLVLCDRRGCPKAYHPSCVNRDEAFFRAKGRWNCGWHLCSICEKNAYYMCYTCTFSLCKGCIKDGVILCVRGNKGFCEACMRTVMLIEKNEQGNKEMGQVDFDDRSSWEYLFKDYWMDLKGRLCFSSDELEQAKNPWKGSDVIAGKEESPPELYDANNDVGSDTESSADNLEESKPKRRRAKKPSKLLPQDGVSPSAAVAEGSAVPGSTEWASKELLEFVMHMKNGDKSVLSQFDVQALLLEYIKTNKLRDPRRKSQIICDSRLENLFGKARVGHFEMLKLLESHFLVKEDSQADDLQGSVVDTDASQLDVDGNAEIIIKGGKDRKRKMRKKGDERGPQSNLDDYAAIDMHNINLIYLRRNLMEDLIGNGEKFHDEVVGSFVRIRISGSVQKQDIYRLVQVVSTSKAAEPYKVGKKTTDIMLEILNLNKTEVISIDIISNQEFTEDECKRLRQSIKCGFINRMTVGDVLEKAMALHAVRINDWLETEIVRLSHLRDRASEKGRRKELRECVEKLQLLKTAEERQRRLEEIPEVHADPNMDPNHESEEDEEESNKKQEMFMRPRGTGFGRRGREPVSPGTGSSALNDSWSGTRKNSSRNWELSRNLSNKGFSNRVEDVTAAAEINENSWSQGGDRDALQSNNGETSKKAADSESGQNGQFLLRSESFPGVGLATPVGSHLAGVAQSAPKISETDKIWHYKDPSGKVQGPFSMVQLRKWSNTGYFPVDLRIWRTTEKQDDSILLTDSLAEFFPKEQPMADSFPKSQQLHTPQLSSTESGNHYGTPLQQGREVQGGERPKFDQDHEAGVVHGTGGPLGSSGGENWRSQPEPSSSKVLTTPSSVEIPKFSRDKWSSDYGSRNDSPNLPSPTPAQNTARWTGGQASESKQPHNFSSAQPVGSIIGSNPLPGGNGVQPSSSLLTAESGQSTNSSGRVPMWGSENDSSSLDGPLLPRSENGVPVSSTNALQIRSQSTMPSESPMNSGSGAKNAGPSLPNVAQSVMSQNPLVETRGWGPGSVSKADEMPGGATQTWGTGPSQAVEPNSSVPVPVQQPVYGQWGPPVHNSASSFSTGNPAATFPNPGFPSLPPAPPNLPWGIGVAENPSSAPCVRPDNPNTVWGPMPGNPNMGWGGPAMVSAVPANTNINWGPSQVPVSGSANPGSAPGSTNMNWGAVGQGPPPGNANLAVPGSTNMNWGATGQGLVPGNANPGWVPPTGNPGMWGNNQNPSGDRFTGQRDRGFRGGDSGHGGGRPRNRQSSFGSGGAGGSSRLPPKLQGVCKFYGSGHCKKGSSCDFFHP